MRTTSPTKIAMIKKRGIVRQRGRNAFVSTAQRARFEAL
jgi:hypothetical protein